MSETYDGFAQMAKDLERAARAVDEPTRKEALKAGADIIVEGARHIIAPHRREGILEENIVSQYKDEEQLIGWSADGFYGRFLENGTSKMDAIPHVKTSYAEHKEKVAAAMINTIKKKMN